MNKPEIKENTGSVFFRRKFDYTSVTDTAAEITMPDYYPEVRRVVAAFAEALPDSRFLSDGKIEYGGTVSFSVLYIGDDGSLCCVPYSGEYSDSVQLPSEVEGSAGVRICTAAENVQCRVTAPRKLSLKAKLKTTLSSDGREYYECSVKSASGEKCSQDTLEFLCKTEKTVSEKWTTFTGSCSGTIPDTGEIKPVMCRGDVNVISVKTAHDAVTVTGEVEVSTVALNSSGVYSTVSCSIPFEETVNMEGVRETDIAAAWGRAAAVSVSSDAGVTNAQAEYDIDITVCRKSEVTVTDDMYSTSYGLETVRSQPEPISFLACRNGQMSQSGEIKRSSQHTPDDYIITALAFPTVDKAEIKSGKIVFAGSCKFKAYVASGGDVICEEGSVPIKYEIPSDESEGAGELLWDCHATAVKVNAKDSGDRINVSAELCFMAEAVKKYKITPITEAKFTGENIKGKNGYVIKLCRPAAGSTVWDVAKKHHASIPELERINGVKRDGITDGKPIIIK